MDVRSNPRAGEPVGKYFGKQALMTQGLERGQKSIKIITSEHKYAIQPSRRYFLFPTRLAKTLHHLPQF